MDFVTIIIQFLNGLAIGSILILLSLGLSIVFGMRGIVNVAHGVFYMLGAYLAHTLALYLQINFWIVLLIASASNFILGCMLEIFTIKPLIKWNRIPIHFMILTLGFAFISQELFKMIWGPEIKLVEIPGFLQGVMQLGPIIYPKYWLFVIGFTLSLSLVIGVFFNKAGIGILVQSLLMNDNVSQALGTNAALLNTLVFGLGAGVAGIAGVLASPILTVSTNMCFDMLMIMFVVIIFGGLGSLLGVVVSGLIIGMVLSFSTGLVHGTFANVFVFIVLIAILMLKPLGLFGRPGLLKL
jgi:branched-subunit amino acid ABC-type transport system permease component